MWTHKRVAVAFVLLFLVQMTGSLLAQEKKDFSIAREQLKDPKSTYSSYLDAIEHNDLEEAKKCWIIDDDNKAGALDTLIGLWISTRKLQLEVAKRFGDLKKGNPSAF